MMKLQQSKFYVCIRSDVQNFALGGHRTTNYLTLTSDNGRDEPLNFFTEQILKVSAQLRLRSPILSYLELQNYPQL